MNNTLREQNKNEKTLRQNKGETRASAFVRLAKVECFFKAHWVRIFLIFMLVFTIFMEVFSGRFGVPTWQDLYSMAGLSKAPPLIKQAQEDETQLHFIDVGQGDCTLIVQGENCALVDAGTEDCEQDLITYLEEVGVEEIDYLIETHPHSDHIGSMDAVLNNFDVKTVIKSNLSQSMLDADFFAIENVEQALKESNAKVEIPQVGEKYALGTGEIEVISTGIMRAKNLNNLSICFMYTAGNFKVLFTGDGEEELEKYLLKEEFDLNADVFKAGHHGSKTSNTADFLSKVKPKIAVVSCGYENINGHPDKEVLENFEELKTEIYRTDLNGSVVIEYSKEIGANVYVSKKHA